MTLRHRDGSIGSGVRRYGRCMCLTILESSWLWHRADGSVNGDFADAGISSGEPASHTELDQGFLARALG